LQKESTFVRIELRAKLLDYFLRSNTATSINFEICKHKFFVYTLMFFGNFSLFPLFVWYATLKTINSKRLVSLTVPKLALPTEN